MDYYKRKQLAMEMIEILKKKNESLDKIYLKVLRKYGLGRKFVEEYFNMI